MVEFIDLLRVAVIYNKKTIDPKDVINIYGIATKEHYEPKTIEKVAAALEKGGHTVKIIEGTMSSVDEMQSFMPKVVAGERPGMVFNMAYGIQGHDRYTHLPAMLEMLGVPYTGSGPESHAIVQDKVMTKIILQRNNLPTANFWVFSSPDDDFEDLTFPVIVKPKMESTSMGMKIVNNWKDLRIAVKEEIEKYQQDALVEQFISGREFAVGLLGNRNHLEVLPIVEFALKDPKQIQTRSDKMKKPIEKVCPAKLDADVERKMKQLCVEAFNKLGLYDYSRVDIRMDAEGRMYILELNSMASLNQTGSFVAAAKAAGYTYDSLINKMLDVASIRHFGESLLQAPKSELEDVRSQSLRIAARSYLRSHLVTTIQFLKQITEINTTVRNIEHVNKFGELVSRRLAHLGFTEHVYQEFDVGDIRYFSNHQNRINDVLLLCHIDTPYSARDFMPFREDGSKIFGTGVAESKGGIAVMLSMLQALRFTRKLRKIKCGILVTTDDSLGGRYSQKLIEQYSKYSKYVLGLKWGQLDGGVITSGYGRDDYRIEIANIHETINPTISELIPIVCKKIIALNKLSKKDCQIRVSSMRANTSYGRAPDYASVNIVTNFTTKTLGNEIEKQIRQILKKQDVMKLDVELTKGVRRDPMVETTATKELFGIVSEQARQLDLKLKSANRLISSDISYVPQGIPALDGMGPLGGEYRTPNEFILRDSLIDRALLLAMVLSECSTILRESPD